ncbi:flagellar hook protein FlgE [Buchnera aphidicola]|uniref:Flagellar hook protein FlgE n=1 Tax=Buchnera aphidicola (Artemisaphis artemisicola) TaxID=1241836 RepID=A0A4D6XJQ5_9GAMM|nr:flagellar hook protein FlgE [Buchnera aphidicola]QCI16009.1 flagellar hook protein FlgE [Buchnera aphidicola (Artemisaphis artemisicola)]
MSIMGAISGLLASNEHMDTISNNIANASTIGYKSSKPVFFDMFSCSRESNSINGNGVGVSNIIQNFNNGMLVETGRDLDLGIVQDGFFRIVDAKGNVHYTRNGQFSLDKNKNIITMEGMYLTGKNKSYPQNTSNNSYGLETLNLRHGNILQEKATSSITLTAVLNSNTNSINDKIDISDKNMPQPEDYRTYINIYNKNGEKEQINISFYKIKKNTWKVDVESNENSINDSFQIEFNSNGELISDANLKIKPKNAKYEDITLNLSNTIEQENSENGNEKFSQDGYPKGYLKTFEISQDGEIVGIYSNKQVQVIGQILLSKFINPEKLRPESGNAWSATEKSGTEIIGIPGDTGFGFLSKKTLETSNVDLNKELINMIVAQRNYQSNAQSFKIEDKIISTIINLI